MLNKTLNIFEYVELDSIRIYILKFEFFSIL